MFWMFFDSSVKDICMNFGTYSFTSGVDDEIFDILSNFKNHPSILKIKSMYKGGQKFSFEHISLCQMKLEISKISTGKASPINDIPFKMLKINKDYFAKLLSSNIDKCIDFCMFPDKLKLAEIIPIHKNGDRTAKNNYRPISLLPCISKLYERIFYNQLNTYFQVKLSKLQCGFRKGFSTQQCLIVLIEKWKHALDQKKSAGAVLTDLSKAFDCVSHNLLIAKLEAYGLDYNSLRMIRSYLSKRYQRVRINGEYSTWFEILFGVPQGSILGPLIFNIYLADYFLCIEDSDVANYADDNTPYAIAENSKAVIKCLENKSNKLFEWLRVNFLKANPDKSHLLLNVKDENLFVFIDSFVIPNQEHVKLLGITLDNKLTFDKHVSKLCRTASQKVHALSRICKHMGISQRRVIMKAFIESQFSYCPLVWMMHSRNLNNRINKIHERALRLVYDDCEKTFAELLVLDDSFTIHERNIQSLAIELFKVIHNLSPEIMSEVFVVKSNLLYCSGQTFETRNVRTVYNGLGTISFLGPKIWALVPPDMKKIEDVSDFKRKIRRWKPEKCPCRLCKTYIPCLGFVDVAL